jgi:hypothetical protein
MKTKSILGGKCEIIGPDSASVEAIAEAIAGGLARGGKATANKFSPLQKKIILAQSAAADGDPAVVITAIDEARLLKPSAAVCKLLEKARNEFDCGSPFGGETLLDMALEEAGETTLAAVKPVSDLREGESVQVTAKPFYMETDGNEVYIVNPNDNDRLCTLDGMTKGVRRNNAQIILAGLKARRELGGLKVRLFKANAELSNVAEWLAGDSDCEGAAMVDQETIAARLKSVRLAIQAAKA